MQIFEYSMSFFVDVDATDPTRKNINCPKKRYLANVQEGKIKHLFVQDIRDPYLNSLLYYIWIFAH